MRKYFIFILMLFFLSPLSLLGQGVGISWSSLDSQVEKNTLKAGIKKQFQEYYKQQEFIGAGWNRVSDFLSFLERNQNMILSSAVNSNGEMIPVSKLLLSESGSDKSLLWGYLGARYAFYKAGKTFPNINFSVCNTSACRLNNGNSWIFLDSLNSNIVKTVNTGIHEGTHLLNGTGRILSEVATCTAQNKWGLPVKISTNSNFTDGVRDFRVSQQRLGEFFWLLENEYNECIIAPLLSDQAFKITSSLSTGKPICEFISEHMPSSACEDCFFSKDISPNVFKILAQVFSAVPEKMELAEQGRFVSVGNYDTTTIAKFYALYYTDYYTTFWGLKKGPELDAKVKESVDQVMQQLSYQGDFYLYIYKVESELASFLSDKKPPVEGVFESLYNLSKTAELEAFYEFVYGKYTEKGFNCTAIFPDISAILDQLAGPQTRSVVPEGYF